MNTEKLILLRFIRSIVLISVLIRVTGWPAGVLVATVIVNTTQKAIRFVINTLHMMVIPRMPCQEQIQVITTQNKSLHN